MASIPRLPTRLTAPDARAHASLSDLFGSGNEDCWRELSADHAARSRRALPTERATRAGSLPIARGHACEAIAILECAAYTADAVAQLLLGACLVAEQRFEDALAVFEHVTALDEAHRTAAALGSGYALLALGRAGDALAYFDGPDDHAVEGRARALELLGRDEEARIERERLIASASRRATLRTR